MLVNCHLLPQSGGGGQEDLAPDLLQVLVFQEAPSPAGWAGLGLVVAALVVLGAGVVCRGRQGEGKECK